MQHVNLDSNQPISNLLLTAGEAAARLGVKLDTLYAYVSRGRLRSVGAPGSRRRRYRAEDIEALRAARGRAGGGEPAAEAAMPVIESTICLIEGGRFYYRGHDVLRLSDSATLEQVAQLLWAPPGGGIPPLALPPSAAPSPAAPPAAARDGSRSAPPPGLIVRCQQQLAAQAGDWATADLTRAGVVRSGERILAALTAAAGGIGPATAPVHRRFAKGWGLDDARAAIVRRCLVLLADHELNASTFVARCVASTGATPYAVVSAALGALSGGRHGGAVLRAAALFAELAPQADPVTAIAERLARGEAVPGIGHPLYPEGDPRAVAILYALSAIVPRARRLVNWRPNVDFALAAAAAALGLPQEAALGLFLIGRSVGWIAHAIEQYESCVLIRPRARYVGPRPEREAI